MFIIVFTVGIIKTVLGTLPKVISLQVKNAGCNTVIQLEASSNF